MLRLRRRCLARPAGLHEAVLENGRKLERTSPSPAKSLASVLEGTFFGRRLQFGIGVRTLFRNYDNASAVAAAQALASEAQATCRLALL